MDPSPPLPDEATPALGPVLGIPLLLEAQALMPTSHGSITKDLVGRPCPEELVT